MCCFGGGKQEEAGVWFASRPAGYAFGVSQKHWAVVAGLGRPFGRVSLTDPLATRI